MDCESDRKAVKRKIGGCRDTSEDCEMDYEAGDGELNPVTSNEVDVTEPRNGRATGAKEPGDVMAVDSFWAMANYMEMDDGEDSTGDGARDSGTIESAEENNGYIMSSCGSVFSNLETPPSTKRARLDAAESPKPPMIKPTQQVNKLRANLKPWKHSKPPSPWPEFMADYSFPAPYAKILLPESSTGPFSRARKATHVQSSLRRCLSAYPD